MAALSEQEENYVRMSLLLTGVSPRAVRVLFDHEFAPVCLSSTLKKEQSKLLDLKSRRIINPTQWNILFPRTGDAESKNFDVTLMICLITNLTPIRGYDRPPGSHDTSNGADLARIKFYRNKLAHLDHNQIETATFNADWKDISEVIERLGGRQMKHECQDLKTKILDQSNQEIMLEVKRLREEIDQMKEIQQDTVPWNIRGQINERLEEWEKTNEKYVVTNATEHVLQCITTNDCVTVTGSSGVGKTATVRHVALQMKEEGYDILPIDDPCDVNKYYRPDKKILCVIDDFCGTYFISQTEFEKWKKQMDLIKQLIDKKSIKLIIGCRLQVYQDQKFKALSLFRTNECNLISAKLALSNTERKTIAKMYLTKKAQKICTFDKFDCFPLLCNLYERNPSFNIQEFFKNPFSVYETELNKMNSEGAHYKICSLALIVTFNNRLQEDWLTDDIEKETRSVLKNTCEACKLDRGTSRLVLRDELDSFINTFLKKTGNVYSTIHDKLFDFLAHYFGKHIITCLIRNADSGLIRERFLFWEQENNDQFITVIPSKYQQMYIERLLEDWSKGEVVNVFRNINMERADFRRLFLCKIKLLESSYQKHLAHKINKQTKDTVLIQCCFNGDVDYIQWCFSQNVDINITRDDSGSPLTIACQEGHTEIVNMLLNNKADINKCIVTGESPLFIACQNGHTEIVNMLLNNKVDINKCMNDGASPLFIACQDCHTETVNMLLNNKVDINKCRETGASPLFIACHEGHTEIVNMLLNNKVDINKCKETGASPLYIACQNSHTEIVNMLLNNKADINKCTNDGVSPLYIACQNGHTKIVNMLLNNKVDINKCTNDGVSPLYTACQESHTEIVNMLLDNKGDINKCTNDGESPLFIACQNGHTEIVNMLLNNKADINKCMNNGASPLYIACQNGHAEIVNMLLNNKADINKCKNDEVSPLSIACHEGHTEIVKMLLNNKADINKCVETGESPLYIACQKDHTEIVKMLLNNKADINKCDNDGESPLYIACQEGHTEIVKR